MAQDFAILEENSRKGQQIATAFGILKGIDLKNIAPEGIATASSLAISYSHYVLSLAQSLPAEQRMAVEAQVKQVIEAVERAVAKAEASAAEQQTREKDIAKQVQFDNQFVPIATLQNPSPTKETLQATLAADLPLQAAQEFTALRSVLDNPAIANEFVPFEVLSRVVNSVFTPTETAEFLVRETVVNGVHQILTNYETIADAGVEANLTRSMVDDFRDVESNQRHIEQCAVLEQRLQQQRQEILAASPEAAANNEVAPNVVEVERVLAEVRNTRVVARTAIGQRTVVDTLRSFGIEARSQLDNEHAIKPQRFMIKVEDGQKVTVSLERNEEDNISSQVLRRVLDEAKKARQAEREKILGGVKELVDSDKTDAVAVIAKLIGKQELSDLDKPWIERTSESSASKGRTP